MLTLAFHNIELKLNKSFKGINVFLQNMRHAEFVLITIQHQVFITLRKKGKDWRIFVTYQVTV